MRTADRTFPVILLFSALLTGFLIRLFHLNDPVGWDEEIVAGWARTMDMLSILGYYRNVGNHFFQTFLMVLSYDIFGDHLWAFRLPTFLAGAALIVAMYFAMTPVFGQRAAIFSAILTSVSSVMILASVNARGYIMQALFIVLLVRAARAPALRLSVATVALFVLILSLGIFTVPSTVGIIPGLALWMLAIGFAESGLKGVRRSFINGLSGGLTAAIITAALYAWPILHTGVSNIGEGISTMTPKSYLVTLQALKPLAVETWAEFHWDVPEKVRFVMLALSALGAIALLFANRLGLLLVVLMPLSTVAVMLQAGFPGLSRTMLFLLPFYLILVAAGLDAFLTIIEKITKTKLRPASVTLIGLVLLSAGIALPIRGEMIDLAPGYARPRGCQAFVEHFNEVLQPGDFFVDIYPQVRFWFPKYSEADIQKWRVFTPEKFETANGKRLFLIVRPRDETLASALTRIPKETDRSQFSEAKLFSTHEDIHVYVLERRRFSSQQSP